MTKQLITEAIEKLEAAQEELRIVVTDDNTLKFLVASQKHYEIGKAISQLKYTLSTI